MEEIEENIKFGDNPDDIILLFKTLDHDYENTRYIYHAMENPHLIDHMDIIVNLFIKNGFYSAIYYFLDGYTYFYSYKVEEKYKKMMLDIFKEDDVYSFFIKNPLDEYYISLLYRYFRINYHAEVSMMG